MILGLILEKESSFQAYEYEIESYKIYQQTYAPNGEGMLSLVYKECWCPRPYLCGLRVYKQCIELRYNSLAVGWYILGLPQVKFV